MDGLECDKKGGEGQSLLTFILHLSVFFFLNDQCTNILEDVSSVISVQMGPMLGTTKRFKLTVQIQYRSTIISMVKTLSIGSEQFC